MFCSLTIGCLRNFEVSLIFHISSNDLMKAVYELFDNPWYILTGEVITFEWYKQETWIFGLPAGVNKLFTWNVANFSTKKSLKCSKHRFMYRDKANIICQNRLEFQDIPEITLVTYNVAFNSTSKISALKWIQFSAPI